MQGERDVMTHRQPEARLEAHLAYQDRLLVWLRRFTWGIVVAVLSLAIAVKL